MQRGAPFFLAVAGGWSRLSPPPSGAEARAPCPVGRVARESASQPVGAAEAVRTVSAPHFRLRTQRTETTASEGAGFLSDVSTQWPVWFLYFFLKIFIHCASVTGTH